MIAKSAHIKKDLDSLRKFGSPKGNTTGFRCFDNLYSLKYGSFTIILASPHSGKSELGFEIIANQVDKFGKRAIIYSPETGSVADIYAELIHKHYGRSIYTSSNNHMDDKQYYAAVSYIDDRYSVIDSDNRSYSYKEILGMVTNEDLIFVDPNNEVNHSSDMGNFSRQDLYIEDIAAEIRRFCKQKEKHAIITMHPTSQQIVFDKETSTSYYPMPNARQAAGGQAWFRKAMGWINLWRPPVTLIDPVTKQKFENNVVIVNIEKARPKGIGKRGTFKMYYDWSKNRYYEKIDGKVRFAFEHEKAPGVQQDVFEMMDVEQPLDSPF